MHHRTLQKSTLMEMVAAEPHCNIHTQRLCDKKHKPVFFSVITGWQSAQLKRYLLPSN